MENNKQNGSLLGDEEKEQVKILEENRQRILSSQEARPNDSGLDHSNELEAGKKKEMLVSPKNLDSGSSENKPISENQEEKNESQIKTTLPPQELLNKRENDITKSKNQGVKNRLSSLQRKKNQSAMILALVLGLFVVIVLTGLYIFSDKLFKKEDLQQIIKSSLEAMNNTKSYAFEGDFNFDFVKDIGEEFALAVKFDGETDERNPDNIKSSFNLKPKIIISQEGGSENIFLDFSMMSFGEIGKETVYLKLNDFDLGAAGMIYGEAIVPYKNEWYFLDMKELQEKSGADMEEDFNSEEMIEKIKELLKQYEMIKFEKDLGDVKIDDTKAYHYQVRLNSEAVLNFYVEVLNLTPSYMSRDSELNDFKTELEQNKEEILVVLDEVMDNTKTEIWIGKKDKMIYKMSMSGKYDQEFMFGLEEKVNKINQKEESDRIDLDSDVNNSSLSFDMTMALSGFNQPVEITKPEESEDLLKILEEAMAGFMSGMISPGINPNLDSDNDGLTDVMEDVYGTDKNNPDTDGDGYLDGDEIENGYDPLLSGSAKLDYGKMLE